MFSRRGTLDGKRKYSREFFQSLVNDLTGAGFDDIKVVLPHNIATIEESEISVEELLRRERNYPSLILRVKSSSNNETLKILFVNRNSRAVFVDDTFPNGESEPPQLYFQSPDPGRTFAVFEFFKEYLKKPSLTSDWLQWFAAVLSSIFITLEILTLVTLRKSWLSNQYHVSASWDVIAIPVAMFIAFKYFGRPKGLWIKPNRELRLLYLANMAIRGELRDNPLVSLIVTVIGGLIVALILKLIGVLK